MSSVGQIISSVTVRVNEVKKKYSESKQTVLALNEILEYLHQFESNEAHHENLMLDNLSNAISISDSTFSLADCGEDSPRDMRDIQSDTLESIRQEAELLALNYDDYNVDKMILLQFVMRRFLLRKRLGDLVRGAYNTPELKSFAKRNEIWREILSTEESYVSSLSDLETYYVIPLKEKIGTPEEIIDKKDFNSIFSNIQLIIKFNSGLLNELKSLTSLWPSKSSIGAIFVDHIPYLKIYIQYVNNFSNSIHVRQNHKSNKKFQAFNLGNQHMLRGVTLSNLLIMPIQRVPRYKMLLESLLKLTPIDHVDHPKLSTAFTMISEITSELDDCKLKAENLEKIYSVFDHISGDLPHTEIYKVGRKYIREGAIKRKNKKSKRYLFLFSDMLIITYVNVDGGKVYEECVNLENAHLSDVPNSLEFMISDSKKKIKFCPVTNGEKMAWIVDISGAIDSVKKPKNTPPPGLTRLRSATLIPTIPTSPRSNKRSD